MRKLITFIIIVFACYSAFSQTSLMTQDTSDRPWKFSAYAQIIPYLDGRDFNNNSYPQFLIPSKIRFGVEKEYLGITFRADIQDSRVLGEEGDPGNNLKNLDLLQGYLQINDIFSTPVDFQLGRFQMQYHDERFIGRSPFHYYERSFDGARFKYNTEIMDWDIFGVISSSDQKFRLGALPGAYEINPADYESKWLAGTWYKNKYFKKFDFHLFGYYEVDPKLNPMGDYLLSRVTAGGVWEGKFGRLRPVIQGAYQFGNISLNQFSFRTMDISAYYLSAMLGYDFGVTKVSVGSDIHSGSDPLDTTTYGLFSNRYGSKHAYFGYMDYFTNIDVQTNNLGAMDFYLLTDTKLTNKLNAVVNVHYFISNKKSFSGETAFGPEFDFGLVYSFSKPIFIEWMNGIFISGNLMKEIWTRNGQIREDPGFMSYLRVVFRI